MRLNAGPASGQPQSPPEVRPYNYDRSKATIQTRRVITMDRPGHGHGHNLLVCHFGQAQKSQHQRRRAQEQALAKRKLIILIYNMPVIIYNLLRPKEEELAIPFKASFVVFTAARWFGLLGALIEIRIPIC